MSQELRRSDLIIVGAGIQGAMTADDMHREYPKMRITVINAGGGTTDVGIARQISKDEHRGIAKSARAGMFQKTFDQGGLLPEPYESLPKGRRNFLDRCEEIAADPVRQAAINHVIDQIALRSLDRWEERADWDSKALKAANLHSGVAEFFLNPSERDAAYEGVVSLRGQDAVKILDEHDVAQRYPAMLDKFREGKIHGYVDDRTYAIKAGAYRDTLINRATRDGNVQVIQERVTGINTDSNGDVVTGLTTKNGRILQAPNIIFASGVPQGDVFKGTPLEDEIQPFAGRWLYGIPNRNLETGEQLLRASGKTAGKMHGNMTYEGDIVHVSGGYLIGARELPEHHPALEALTTSLLDEVRDFSEGFYQAAKSFGKEDLCERPMTTGAHQELVMRTRSGLMVALVGQGGGGYVFAPEMSHRARGMITGKIAPVYAE